VRTRQACLHSQLPLLCCRRPLLNAHRTGNFYHCNIDENIVKELATSFKSNGMAAVGYSYHLRNISNTTGILDWLRIPYVFRSLGLLNDVT
jgi:hypothetical protein